MAKVFIFYGLILTRIQKKVQNEHPNKTVSKTLNLKARCLGIKSRLEDKEWSTYFATTDKLKYYV